MNRTRKPRSDAKLQHIPGETVKEYAARAERARVVNMTPEQRKAYTAVCNKGRDRWRKRNWEREMKKQKLYRLLRNIQKRHESLLSDPNAPMRETTPTGRIHRCVDEEDV